MTQTQHQCALCNLYSLTCLLDKVPIVPITLSNATTGVPTLQQPVFLLTDLCPCFKLEWVTPCATTTGV